MQPDFADLQWCGDIDDETPAEARFLASSVIAGIPMHVEGIQVTEDAAGVQVAAYRAWEQWLHDAFSLAQPDRRFMTLQIGRGEYVIIAYAFSA